MKTVFVETTFRDRNFQGLGACYEKKEDALAHLRRIAEVAGTSNLNYYSAEYLFLQYTLDGVKYDISFETIDVQWIFRPRIFRSLTR